MYDEEEDSESDTIKCACGEEFAVPSGEPAGNCPACGATLDCEE